ncbi:MAG: hypothetical protein ACK47F_11070, partial [Flavobacteriales bacterium]
MKRILTLFLVLSSLNVFAQPANDACTGSQTVLDDGTCVNGTTVAATDNWTGLIGCQLNVGGPGGNHLDVFYSFVASESSLSVDVTAGAGWAGTIEVTLLSPGPLGCADIFTQINDACGTGTVNLTQNGLVPGNTYYVVVSNAENGTPGAFTICTETVAAGCGAFSDDCANAVVVPTTTNVQSCVSSCNTGAIDGPTFVGSVPACLQFGNPTAWFEVTSGVGDANLEIDLSSST